MDCLLDDVYGHGDIRLGEVVITTREYEVIIGDEDEYIPAQGE
jgi:hypothetical protein